MKRVLHHLISAISLTFITLNLLFWIPFLVLFALLNLLPLPRLLSQAVLRMTEVVYRLAVIVDTFWLTRVLGIRLDIEGELPARDAPPFVVVSNHRSWLDILILQAVISRNGPMVKFLVKRELMYVPVVGWICLALRFPMLTRGKSSGGREKDLKAVQEAIRRNGEAPAALMNFAEGTRFTQEKHDQQKSPHQHMLVPKTGGLRIMLDHLPGCRMLDATMYYPLPLNFWECLSGRLKHINVRLVWHEPDPQRVPRKWLEQLWYDKDAWYEAQTRKPG
ncbi:MAG: 1-acyl-sn-glycerol-3-phosphate acyltransferase [Pseudomonadales bacterium]|nr:1-acyl-sn-glycerol-3-phosphate acyltransferase [Pseudomonadales bacterium]